VLLHALLTLLILPIQVDGFRFDIMGHMLLRTLNKMRAALDGLTVEKDGVDGK
jgi:pullulanase/glycogen debranching enzyme